MSSTQHNVVGRITDNQLEVYFAEGHTVDKGKPAHVVGTVKGLQAIGGLASIPTAEVMAVWLASELGDSDRPMRLNLSVGGAPIGTQDLRTNSGARLNWSHVANSVMQRIGGPADAPTAGGAVDRRDAAQHRAHTESHVSVADALKANKKLSEAVSQEQERIRAQRALARAEAERVAREDDRKARKEHQRKVLIEAGFSEAQAAAAISAGMLA